jgi:hypothetical protein
MKNFITLSFNVNTAMPLCVSEFFHLDAEITHPVIGSAQILSFDLETNSCIAELFIGSLSKEEFQHSINIHKPTIWIDNKSIDYSITDIK